MHDIPLPRRMLVIGMMHPGAIPYGSLPDPDDEIFVALCNKCGYAFGESTYKPALKTGTCTKCSGGRIVIGQIETCPACETRLVYLDEKLIAECRQNGAFHRPAPFMILKPGSRKWVLYSK